MGSIAGREHPTSYQIRVTGTLDAGWSDWFGGLLIEALDTGETLLTGPVADQPALYGILWKLRDLNLSLISLVLVENETPEQA